jgi:hypothetical protein
MRVLRLDLGPGLGEVDLHPFVTVLSGFDPQARDRLVEAVRAVAQGRDAGVSGLVENEGLLIELVPGGPGAVVARTPGEVGLDLDALPADAEARVGLVAELDQAARRAAIDAALVEEARGELDLTAAAELDRLERHLAGQDSTGSPGDAVGSPRDAVLSPLDAVAEVDSALAAWAAVPPTVVVAARWTAELRARWEEHCRRSAEHEARLACLANRIETAGLRLADAVATLAAAEAAAVPVLLSPQEENRLAELATRPAAKGLLRGSRGRPEEDQAEIDALLAKAGQPTYAAYMMFRLAPTASPEQQAAVDAARAALRLAEQELAAATAARDHDPVHRDHQERLEALRSLASRHLGPILPDDLGAVLADHTEVRPNPEREPARRRLVEVAARHAVPVEDPGDDPALAAQVAAWVDARRAELAALNPPDRAELLAAASAAARRLDRHRRALARLDRLDAAARDSHLRCEQLAAQLAALDAGAATASRLLAEVERRIADLVPAGEARAVPLVLAASFAGVEPGTVGSLLDRLEERTGEVQLLILTDHPEAVAWAGGAGLRRAFLVAAGVGQASS